MRAFALVLLAAAACSPYSPDLGAAPFLCGSGAPQCPDGYTCASSGSAGVCTKMGSGVPVDGTPDQCQADSALEPNDSITMAWQTPVDTTKKSFPLSDLAICPAGDKDTYAMTITTTGENIEVLIDYDVNGAALQGSILASTGISVASAMPISGSPGHLRAYLANANAATFYAQVFGPAQGMQTNTYNLTINITGP